MNINIKQITNMHKIRCGEDMRVNTLHKKMALKGQKFTYQIALSSDNNAIFKVDIESPLKKYIKLYAVKSMIMDLPVPISTKNNPENNDFITKEPGLMPDMLLPLEEQDGYISFCNTPAAVWVEVNLPEEIQDNIYEINIIFTNCMLDDREELYSITEKLELEVINAVLPKQSTVFTQWLHADCIAGAHNVEMYSEEHWNLIDKYISLAAELGINMMLTPVITPSLDIDEKKFREKTQLTDVEKVGDIYHFKFDKLKRWIEICRKHGIKYLEIAHLFTQWGLKYSPNILVSENDKKDYMFGWHISSRDIKYKEFLEQFIPALTEFLKTEGMIKNTCFHISDEPDISHLDNYRYAYNIVKPLIGECKIMDAISDYEFFEERLMDVPVPINSAIEPFIKNGVEELYTYYCCGPDLKESNRFMSMPSYRNRIIGLQMYKFGIKGFLHWGYNFYNTQLSRYQINPYMTTSADLRFPSGDSFSVYPYKDGVIPSLRAIVFRDALEDIEICRLLEGYISKDAVIELIEQEAGMEITFSEYPRNSDFLPDVMNKILEKIKEYV